MASGGKCGKCGKWVWQVWQVGRERSGREKKGGGKKGEGVGLAGKKGRVCELFSLELVRERLRFGRNGRGGRRMDLERSARAEDALGKLDSTAARTARRTRAVRLHERAHVLEHCGGARPRRLGRVEFADELARLSLQRARLVCVRDLCVCETCVCVRLVWV